MSREQVKNPVHGVKQVIICNEGLLPQKVSVCFSQQDGCLYVHVGGSRHGEEVTVLTHQQFAAPVNVIPRERDH
jgi:hypothetical protein